MHVCSCVHVSIWLHVAMYIYAEAKARPLVSFSITPHLTTLNKSLSLTQKLLILERLNDFQALGFHLSLFPMLGLQAQVAMVSFLHRCWKCELTSLCLHSKYQYASQDPPHSILDFLARKGVQAQCTFKKFLGPCWDNKMEEDAQCRCSGKGDDNLVW